MAKDAIDDPHLSLQLAPSLEVAAFSQHGQLLEYILALHLQRLQAKLVQTWVLCSQSRKRFVLGQAELTKWLPSSCSFCG